MPSMDSLEKTPKFEDLMQSAISRNREPQMLGIASISEKLIASFRSMDSILEAVIQIPKRLTPGNIAIV